MRSSGWRPVAMASTIARARKASGSSRPSERRSVPSRLARARSEGLRVVMSSSDQRRVPRLSSATSRLLRGGILRCRILQVDD